MRKYVAILGMSLLSSAAFAGDAAAGKAKAVMCAACHGKDGMSAIPMYPNLAGQKVQYLEKQLKAFRDGTRKDPVMGPMSKALSDADIANLSTFYSTL